MCRRDRRDRCRRFRFSHSKPSGPLTVRRTQPPERPDLRWGKLRLHRAEGESGGAAGAAAGVGGLPRHD
jgi:hypothetical protein